jgi:hypothetical protein
VPFDFSGFAQPETKKLKIDMTNVSVMLGMPTNRDLSPQTVVSLLTTQDALNARGVPNTISLLSGSSIVEHARSKCADDFLASPHNRFFQVDSDIVWKPEDFMRLLALSTVMDVVGAAYPAKLDPPLYFLNRGPNDAIVENEYGCLSIPGFGLGFTVVHRKVMEKLAAEAPKVKFHERPAPVAHIFRCDVHDGAARGEDMAFFADIKAAGFDVWIDPNISLGHIGPKVYSASLLDCLNKEH